MAKKLVLSSISQSLTIGTVVAPAFVAVTQGSTTEFALERISETEQALVPVENLLTINGSAIFTAQNNVLEL